MYSEAMLDSYLLPTLMNATIILLLKKDKDPLLHSSYRPISVLNVDYKIVSKILALYLQHVLSQIISSDQTGFMLGTVHKVVVLDVEKTFDRVQWKYLFEVMERLDLGCDFISRIKLLYSSPIASAQMNNLILSPFQLHCGTKQICATNF